MASTFQIDPADYLSIDYESFRDDMLELALSSQLNISNKKSSPKTG
jgi:hypothetical protein